MLTDEALEVLALKPGATPSEIKEAYRDLVKVWHPDRFGNDLRLREKAELQLKLINEAYRVLQSNPGVNARYAPGSEGAASSSPRDSPSSRGAYGRHDRASPISQKGRGRSGGNGAAVRWIYGGLGILVILLAGYFFIEYAPTQSGGASHAAVGQQSGTRTPVEQAQAPRSRGVGRSKDQGSGSFRVRSLSAAETDRLQMLCSKQKELSGQVAYHSCLKAQLDWMTNPAGKPDLSTLRQPERESIESVCSEARRLHGQDRYNRCATEQVANLAAEPARPEISTLNDADRHSIQSACANAKSREGPAAYNRCLERFLKVLAEAGHP
ncbi:MAG: hypothetical protein QOH35_5662 [Acidobacteriaceae bacterium]|nr:hypothetical protein [Acidobacteriaceae bacterium]